jgi:imidazole glycerol-phosphate synthase subunit HisH
MINNLGVINSDISNIKSITNLLDHVGQKYQFINNKFNVESFDGIILPGVGNFKEFVKNLKKKDIYESLIKYISKKKNFLGICLGMQFLFEESEEASDEKGINFLEGKVVKFNFKNENLKIPHIGKKKIYIQKNKINNTFFESFNSEEFYFLHSYYCKAELSNELAYTTYNDVKFSSAIIKDKIIGVQFHPEKSAKNGINFIKNFLKEEIAIK